MLFTGFRKSMKLMFMVLLVLLVTGCMIVPVEPMIVTSIDRVTDSNFIYTCLTRTIDNNNALWDNRAYTKFYSHKRFAIGDTVELVKKGR